MSGPTFHICVLAAEVLLLLILLLLLHVEDRREQEVHKVIEQTIHSCLLQGLRKLLCKHITMSTDNQTIFYADVLLFNIVSVATLTKEILAYIHDSNLFWIKTYLTTNVQQIYCVVY